MTILPALIVVIPVYVFTGKDPSAQIIFDHRKIATAAVGNDTRNGAIVGRRAIQGQNLGGITAGSGDVAADRQGARIVGKRSVTRQNNRRRHNLGLGVARTILDKTVV